MVKRLIPENTLLSRALWCLVGFLFLTGLSLGFSGLEDQRLAQVKEDQEVLARSVWQYGLGSPQAEAIVRHMGEQSYPKELVAVLDPRTDRAVLAWPAAFVGQVPEAMQLNCGVRLPSLEQLCLLEKIILRRPQPGPLGGISNRPRDRVQVRLYTLVPWKTERLEGLERHLAFPAQAGIRSLDDRHPLDPTNAQAVLQPQAYLLVVGAQHVITPLSVAARASSALGALCFLVYWLSIATWVFREVQRRGGSAFAWGTLVLFTNLVGAAIYLLIRSEHPLCPCGADRDPGHRHCPACGRTLVEPCPACGQPLRSEWAHCVNCGSPRME